VKRAWASILIVFFCMGITVISAVAGPFDQLKNLKVDPKTMIPAQHRAVDFTFTNFKTTQDAGDAHGVWTVDLKISQSIPANAYLVRAVFQNRDGEALFSSEDISLPAGNAGKTHHLTRPFEKNAKASEVLFQVYHQVENTIVTSQAYPVPAISPYVGGMQAVTASGKPAPPQRVSGGSAKIDTGLDIAFLFSPIIPDRRQHQQFQIQNRGSFPVKIEKISAKSKFLVGIDQDIEDIRCSTPEIQAGQSVECFYLIDAIDCPTLSMIEFTAEINGTIHHGELKIDAPVKMISSNPIIRLSKKRESGCWEGNGSGEVDIIIRGSYVKPGGVVTMKALASVDSDRFPVVIEGYQKDDGIHGHVSIVGTKYLKAPDVFCFHLMEITTCDEPRCGGVGAVLYRNHFDSNERNTGGYFNLFLIMKHCE